MVGSRDGKRLMDGQMDGSCGRDQGFRIRGGAQGNVDGIRTEISRLRAANGISQAEKRRGWAIEQLQCTCAKT